jgi:hypothetical protein
MDWKIALFLTLIIGLMVAGVINTKILEKPEEAEGPKENVENKENMTGMQAFNVKISRYMSAWGGITCQRNV